MFHYYTISEFIIKCSLRNNLTDNEKVIRIEVILIVRIMNSEIDIGHVKLADNNLLENC
jgi:hypothetical protein